MDLQNKVHLVYVPRKNLGRYGLDNEPRDRDLIFQREKVRFY